MGRDVGDASKEVRGQAGEVTLRELTGWKDLQHIGGLEEEKQSGTPVFHDCPALTAPFPRSETSGQGVISYYNSRSMPPQPHPPSFQDGQLVAITHLLWELLAGSALQP